MRPPVFWQTSLQAFALFASTGLALWAAAVARSRRSAPGGSVFAWLMIAVAIWSGTSALHTLVTDSAARILIAKIQYLGIAPVGVLWLLFASRYARTDWPADRLLRWLVWVIPVITVILVATNERHRLHWASIVPVVTPYGIRLQYTGGPWYWVNAGYTYLLMATATIMVVVGLRRAPPPYRRQTNLILCGAIVPWVGNLLYLTRLVPVAGLDLTPIAFTISGACVTMGLYRYRLFGLVPVAREMVVDSMDDGVLVLDSHRRIVDMNAAAERYTGCSPASFGRPVDEVVAWWTEVVADDIHTTEQPAVVRTEPGPRYFEVKVSAVRDSQRRFVGWLVVIHDISRRRRGEAERYALDRRMQEQQKTESLMVLAGGVAHDFNNLLTGILGNADLLAMQSAPDSGQRRAAEAIVIGAQRAADLVSKMLAYAGGGRVVAELVDLDALVREMVDLLEASVARHCTLIYKSPGALPHGRNRPHAHSPGRAQPDHQRHRSRGRRRRRHRGNRRGDPGSRSAQADDLRRRRATGTVRLHRRGGQRPRDERRDALAPVRSVLLDEGNRSRAGDGGGARHHSQS